MVRVKIWNKTIVPDVSVNMNNISVKINIFAK